MLLEKLVLLFLAIYMIVKLARKHNFEKYFKPIKKENSLNFPPFLPAEFLKFTENLRIP